MGGAGSAGGSGGSGGAGGAGGPSGSGEPGGADDALLDEKTLDRIEREHVAGLTSVQIVELFLRAGIRFSEATFRKYVQLGLVPRSRRVGRKGKHQGSLGLYPASTVRRINMVKRLMASDLTIEAIQRSYLRFRDEVETLERASTELLASFEAELDEPRFDPAQKKAIGRELEAARATANDLIERVEKLERQLIGARDRAPGSAGPRGAEDLL